jgi:DNA-binding CsgD family transcriptional regulator
MGQAHKVSWKYTDVRNPEAGPAASDLNELLCTELMTGELHAVDPRLLESLPWKKVNDSLVAVGSQRSLEMLAHVALKQIGALVPLDSARFVVWLGPRQGGPARLTSRGNPASETLLVDLHGSPEAKREYFEHFIMVDPTLVLYPSTHRAVVSWWRHDCEFTRDFMRRYGTRHAMHVRNQEWWGGKGFSFHVRRATRCGFTEREMALFFTLRPHLNNLVSLIRDPAKVRRESLAAASLACGLTPRESEVALLLCDRLSATEIADRLRISCRTVEKHTERLYTKLRVNNRRGLREEMFLSGALDGDRQA